MLQTTFLRGYRVNNTELFKCIIQPIIHITTFLITSIQLWREKMVSIKKMPDKLFIDLFLLSITKFFI